MSDERLMEIVEAMESGKCPGDYGMPDASLGDGNCYEDCRKCWGNAIRLELDGDPS